MGDFAGTLTGASAGPDWQISTTSHTSTMQSNGVATFTTDGTKDDVASYRWNMGPRSLLGCSVAIDVPSAPPAGADLNGFFQFVDPTATKATHVGFSKHGAALSFITFVNGAMVSSPTINYDPVQHRKWRFREAGGVLFWETSPDGSVWTSQSQISTPSWANAGVLTFGIGALSNTTSGSISFDELE